VFLEHNLGFGIECVEDGIPTLGVACYAKGYKYGEELCFFVDDVPVEV